MKIFSSVENNSIQTSDPAREKVKKRGIDKHGAIEKKEFSEQEIRDKLASHVETSNKAKLQNANRNSEPLGLGFMNSDLPVKKFLPPAGPDKSDPGEKVPDNHVLVSDVRLNDPNDTNTQEKLKSALKNGSFNFNSKEREALEKILMGH